MRREKLEHLVTTGMIEGKGSRGKQREEMLDGRIKCLKVERVTEELKVTRDREIAYAKELGTLIVMDC